MSRERPNHPESDMDEKRRELQDRAEEVTDYVRDTAGEAASRVRERSGEMADKAVEKFDQGRQAAAGTLDRAALKLHSKAESVPGGSRSATAAHKMADGMERAAAYIREHDAKDIGADAADLMRRYPSRTLIGALALGFLIGRTLRR